MKRTKYHLVMSSGQKFDIEEQSAAVAIQSALAMFPGRTVVECRAGLTEEEAMEFRRNGIDRDARAGVIHFEIPVHSALTEDEAFKPKRVKKGAETPLMFAIEEVVGGKLDPRPL